jgi:hypothetical protein
MATEDEAAVAALLRETERAHGAYEKDALGGVRDQEWAKWYAAYLLDHGLANWLPGAGGLGVAGLGRTLSKLASDYERERPADAWPEVYAKWMVASLG